MNTAINTALNPLVAVIRRSGLLGGSRLQWSAHRW
jgi:hypothetical protein